jgi:hypothetical protein
MASISLLNRSEQQQAALRPKRADVATSAVGLGAAEARRGLAKICPNTVTDKSPTRFASRCSFGALVERLSTIGLAAHIRQIGWPLSADADGLRMAAIDPGEALVVDELRLRRKRN